MRMAGRIGIDCLSIFGLPPTQFIELAAKLGCDFVTLGVPVTINPESYPEYSLKNPVLQREIKQALCDHGVTVKVGEGVFFMPGTEARHFAAHLDALAEIGAQRANIVSMNCERERLLDQCAMLAEMAAARGLSSSIEFVAGHTIGSVKQAVEAVRHVGRSDFKLVLDMLHVARTGAGIDDLAALDPDMIGYIQLCDCRGEPENPMHEVMYERLPPGVGECPLLGWLRVLPRDVPVGIEVPQLSLAKAGVGPKERLAVCVAAARALLAKVDGADLQAA